MEPSASVSHNQSSFIVPASGIQDLASFSRLPAVEDENGPKDDSSIHTANILIIGDKTVGKSSLARMFSKTEHSTRYTASTGKTVYNINLLLDQQLVEAKLIDIPAIDIETFPVDRQEEWNRHRHYSLLGADIYLLVFDLTKPASFNYIKKIRDKILSTRVDLSFQFIVAANKVDLVKGEDTAKNKPNQENISLVRKHWRCPYIEVSARNNYNVSLVFRNITQLVISQAHGATNSHHHHKHHCWPFSSINIFNFNSY